MKNSEVSTDILIQRNFTIQENLESAMVYLDTEVKHTAGRLVMVKYKTGFNTDDDPSKPNIDTLFAVGVKDGEGRNCYSLISTAESYVIYDICEDDVPRDVSDLVQGQRFLCKMGGIWKIELLGPDKVSRIFIDIPEGLSIFRNLADGFQYYYNHEKGELVREDNFITPENLIEKLKDVENNIDPPTISHFEVIRDESYLEGEGNIYPHGAVITDLGFNLQINNYKDEDITGQFMIRVLKNGSIVNITKIDNNSYSINGPITETSTYEVIATNEDTTLREMFTISIVSPTYFGKMSEFSIYRTFNLPDKTLWDGNGDIEFITNLNNEITVLAVPIELQEEVFTSIKDTHGLNYINDYYIEDQVLNTIDGVYYKIYHKKDQVTINNFKQTFGYE